MTIPISMPEVLLRHRLAGVAEREDLPLTVRQVELLAREGAAVLAPLLGDAPPRDVVGRPLAPMQATVLIGIANGMELKAVARRTGRSFHTVKSHARLLYRRLGVRDRAHAVAVALAEGLIAPGCVERRTTTPTARTEAQS